MCSILTEMIVDGQSSTPKLITNRLLKYCMDLTASSREYMEQNPFVALSHDYNKYPGKMDHATCIAFRVGIFDNEKEKEKDKEYRETYDPKIWPF